MSYWPALVYGRAWLDSFEEVLEVKSHTSSGALPPGSLLLHRSCVCNYSLMGCRTAGPALSISFFLSSSLSVTLSLSLCLSDSLPLSLSLSRSLSSKSCKHTFQITECEGNQATRHQIEDEGMFTEDMPLNTWLMSCLRQPKHVEQLCIAACVIISRCLL